MQAARAQEASALWERAVLHDQRVKLRDIAARELRRLGSRRPAEGRRAARTGGDALAPRERDIADLVAQGRTNKEVAATLFLSEKTVEHHLSRVYAKVGVRSRVELARELTDAM